LAQFHFYGTGGISISLGTPVNRLGFYINARPGIKHVGARAEIAWHRVWSGVGRQPPKSEWMFAVGPSVNWGKGKIFNEVWTARPFPSQVTYQFRYYLDKYTPQTSGNIIINSRDWEINIENDALGFQGKDRYRTGGISVSYFRGHSKFGLNTQLWTGNTHSPKAKYFSANADSKYSKSYKDISAAEYGRVSHGILTFDFGYRLPYFQKTSVRIGLDAEQVRHFLQNKLMHDWLLFFTKYNGVENPHLPMLDENGNPVIDLKSQKPREIKPVFQIEANSSTFY